MLLPSLGAKADWTDEATGVSYSAIDGPVEGGEGSVMFCDGDTNTKLGTGSIPTWVIIQASQPVSLIGYTIFTAMIRSLTVQMDNFTEAFMAKIKLEQLEFDKEERGA